MKHDLRGFTLIELMTAILVLGVLLAMAIPSYREMSRSNRMTASTNDLVTALATARGEALRGSTPVSLCASTDGSNCVTVATGTTDWSGGWIAFTDSNGTLGTIDSGDAPIQKWGALSGDAKINGSASFITYTRTGMLDATRTFDVFFTGCVGNQGRHIDTTLIGLVTTTSQTACP